MRIAITGSRGQLGTALSQALTDDTLLLIDLPEHDITDLAAIRNTLVDFEPDVVIHGAAITDVDGCERNPDLAYRVNVLGTRNMAVCAQQCGAEMVYISTDYVFDGQNGTPYWEYDTPNPLSVYARTKWLGETVVRDHCQRFYIVRVAWLYGAGPRNFVKTVVRLAKERDSISMVTDESGSPTNANDVAQALDKLIRTGAYGLYQLPNAGVCSRYEWAQEILRLTELEEAVELLPSENYQRAAKVPAFAEMRNFSGAQLGITMRPWQDALSQYIQEQM